MAQTPRALLSIARDRHGLVTVDELTAARVVGRSRTALLASGQLVPVHRGVYRFASHAITFDQRCAAACLAAPDAALSGPSAARDYRFRKVSADDVHIVATRAIELQGVHAHRTDLMDESDVVVRSGMRMLRPARLICDLASHLDEPSLESVIEQALDRGLVSIPLLRAQAARFISPGRPGSVRLRRVLEARPGWLKPVDSDLELRLWRALVERGVQLDRQVRVVLDGGVVVHVDLADPAARFGIEVDHIAWHGGRLETQRDKRRDLALTRLGWTISRVTDDDIDERLAATVDQLVVIAARCARRAG